MSSSGTPLEHTEEGRAFLQHRIARFGLLGSGLGWFFLAYVVIGRIISGRADPVLPSSFPYHCAAALSLLSLWLLCWRSVRSVRFLRVAETAAVLLACGFYALMALRIPFSFGPHYVLVLALSFALMTRAIYVPSSAHRTVLLTALVGAPMLVATFLLHYTMDPALLPADESRSLLELGLANALYIGAWWLCAVAICGGASRVIYGLRQEVRDVRKLGRYTLMDKLGEGGMGAVYRARHAMLRRPTAVKLLPVAKAGAHNLARFEREVQLTAMLTHPNTVTVFDYGRTPEGVFYYAMELLDGATLAEVVELSGVQSPARVLQILVQVADALAEAHAVGLIHRDIKPSNVMLVEQGGKPDVAKVLDFGLVRELASADETSLTGADGFVGTPHYIAPEAISSPDSVDARSDIYALGAVGYYLLTGTPVFEGKTVVAVCSAHLHKAPVPLSARRGEAVPAALEALLLCCLAKSPEERPQSAGELRAALLACAAIPPWTEADARAWWHAHGEALRERHPSQLRAGSGLTLDIDLLARRGAARRGPARRGPTRPGDRGAGDTVADPGGGEVRLALTETQLVPGPGLPDPGPS